MKPPAPSTPSAPSTQPLRPSSDDVGDRRRVLVVDDDELLAESIGGWLSRFHDVTVCFSITDAREKLEASGDWDVVLCDLHLREASGVEWLEEVSRVWPALAPRFVFMTGSDVDDVDDATPSVAALPNARLAKPFDLRRLLEVIAGMEPVSGRRSERRRA